MTLFNRIAALASTTFIATFVISSVAFAAPNPVQLESILVRSETVRVEYSTKLAGCSALFDKGMQRYQDSPFLFCDSGRNVVVELPIEHFIIEGGDQAQLCNLVFAQCSAPVTARQAGDLNDDGEINVIDLQLMHAWIMGNESSSWPAADLDLEAADIDGDGEVNVIDILLLLEALWDSSEA
jgi:hypothetical protein